MRICRSHVHPSQQVRCSIYRARLGGSRFLQVDPIEGGSANDYDYADADPINGLDISGTVGHRKSHKKGKEHTKGRRGSTKGVHDMGKARKKRDAGGEKGDLRRPYQRFGGADPGFAMRLATSFAPGSFGAASYNSFPDYCVCDDYGGVSDATPWISWNSVRNVILVGGIASGVGAAGDGVLGLGDAAWSFAFG